MNNCQPQTLENIFSKPRLSTYIHYFNTTNHEEVIGIYLWNGAIAAHFSTLLGYFEIALRNKIHRSISYALSAQTSYSTHWYDSLTLDAENKSKVENIRYKGRGKKRKLKVPAPTPDEIVSRVSFGFWPHSLTILQRLYGTVMPQIFPNHALTPLTSPGRKVGWEDPKARKIALAYLYELNTLRNRIAHHEPIWKFSAIMDTSMSPPVVLVPESLNLSDSLSRLHRILMHIDQAFMSIDQDYYKDFLQFECRQQLNCLLTVDGFNRYKYYKNIPGPAVTPADFRKQFSLLVKRNRPVLIKLGDKRGVFSPD